MGAIICSHGFGVTADSRGMFPEIAAAIPAAQFVMFDYNEVKPNGDTIGASLDEQATKLQEQIDMAGEGCVLLCHSQGSIVAGLADLSSVAKVILLAPPVNMSMQRTIQKMYDRPGSKINLDGTSVLPRSDGTVTYLPKTYLESLDNYVPMDLYQRIADTVPTVIVRATEDEVIGLTNVDEIQHAAHYDVVANHNFEGDARSKLVRIIRRSIA